MDTPATPVPIHVCIVTTAHPIDDVRVNNKIAHAFRSAGFRVTWVGPGNAFFDKETYNRDGIVFIFAPPVKNRLTRLISRSHVRKLAAAVPNVDVYYSPDPDSAPISAALAKKNHAKSIFDIHEIYHGALLERWLFGRRVEFIREFVRKRIAKTCMQCDLVMGVSDAVLDPVFHDMSRRMVVRSCAPSWFADGPAADVCGEGRQGLKMMHGKGYMSYGTAMVLDAMEIVRKEAPGPKVVVMCSGDPDQDPTAQEVKAYAASKGIVESVILHKGVPLQAMPDLLRSCDVGLISYGRNLGVDILPNRIFEYLALGIPIIAPDYAVEIARIVGPEQCGLLVDFESPRAIADAVKKLQEDPALCREMGRRGREGFLARHNLEVEVAPLLDRIRSWYPEKAEVRC